MISLYLLAKDATNFSSPSIMTLIVVIQTYPSVFTVYSTSGLLENPR